MNLAPEGHRLLSGSSSSSTAAPTITLDGGEPFPAKFVALWRSGRFTDTVVTVEDRGFLADRKVLAAGCDYFERHYDHVHMRDADHPKLLEHVTAAAFEPLLAFLYEGACTFDESLLAPVLQAAHYLGVAPLERACVAALTERLSPSNALAVWTWGEELELPELLEAAKVTALKVFDDVEKIEEATLAQVQALVADDRLTATSEEVVFSAVARFAEAKQPAEADLHDLLRSVRFPLMSEEFLQGPVRNWPMLQTLSGQQLLFELKAPTAGLAQMPRWGFGVRSLYVMGGSGGGDLDLATVEIYNGQANTWRAGLQLPFAFRQTAAAVLDGKIYLIGESKTMLTFDTRTGGAWEAMRGMRKLREAPSAAAAGGRLYVLGGRGARDSVESFDPRTGFWTNVARLPTDRWSAGAAELDDQIYLVGGRNFSVIALDTVEVYDPYSNTWADDYPPMTTSRSKHGVAAFNGKIYAAGGIDDRGKALRSVEAYDPQTMSWAAVAPLSTLRYNVSLAVLGNKLYAVGGRVVRRGGTASETPEIISLVESYDPQHDRWEAVAPMAEVRQSAAVVCV